MVNFPVSPEKTRDYFHTLLHATMRSHQCKCSLFTAFFLYLMCSLGFHDGDDDVVVCFFFLSFIALLILMLLFLASRRHYNDDTMMCDDNDDG